MKDYDWNANVEIPLTGIVLSNAGREVWATSDMASLKVFDDDSLEMSRGIERLVVRQERMQHVGLNPLTDTG